ncbi:MAG: hypothetical protein VZR09_04230 [Candidatus Gastranaerophilaceae bacterium]|jgi:hypothetical protein|nr:hypothetical protein [Candidatus Gastranaerophilaceae bacterium]
MSYGLKVDIRAFAEKYNYGIGNFGLKDGSSVKILNDVKSGLTHVWHMKDGKIISAQGGRGDENISSMLYAFKDRAINSSDIMAAYNKSFHVE